MDFIHAINTSDIKPATKWQLKWWAFKDHVKNHIPYRWREWYWSVYRFFFPCHKSLRKTVPKVWNDLGMIIEEFLFACIISYVEEEDGLNRVVWPRNEKRLIQRLYKFAKTERHEIAKRVQDSCNEWYKVRHPAGSEWKDTLNNHTPEADRLFEIHGKMEAAFERRKRWHLKKILEMKDRLWT